MDSSDKVFLIALAILVAPLVIMAVVCIVRGT